MKIIMSDIIKLKELYPKLKDSNPPVKIGYKLVRIFEEIDKIAKFYGEELSKILQDCAQKDENGNPILTENGTQVTLIEDKIQECGERMTQLNTMEVECDTKYTLEIDDLDYFNDLTLDDIKVLSVFID